MKPTVYIETSVISYLASKPSRNVVIASRQAISLDWWENHRHRFELRISILVEDEIKQSDPEAANFRIEKVAETKSLSISDETTKVAAMRWGHRFYAFTFSISLDFGRDRPPE